MSFYQGFTLDTLLGSLSCILGIAALFIGGKAYKKCKIIKSSLNDSKEFHDSSSDHSQCAAGDIINNNCDVNALANLTNANFEVSLKQAISTLEEHSKINLQQILEQTSQIVKEHKPNISGLTKVDWINIYFESAKNTSDEYMQNIWAKVLARELEFPGSFSYKTLDILKNMSSENFRLFEKMLPLQVEGFILMNEVHRNKHLQWKEYQILREHGLINLENTQRTITLKAQEDASLLIGRDYIIKFRNDNDEEASVNYDGYLLSTAAKEIMEVLSIDYTLELAVSYAKYIRDAAKNISGVSVELHKVNQIIETRYKYNVNYSEEELIG